MSQSSSSFSGCSSGQQFIKKAAQQQVNAATPTATKSTPEKVAPELTRSPNKEKENGKKKRRKKVMVRVGEDYIQYLKEQTLPPPYQPARVLCPLATELEERIVARDKAKREERERILKQHKDKGFAEMEVVITVNEEEEEEV